MKKEFSYNVETGPDGVKYTRDDGTVVVDFKFERLEVFKVATVSELIAQTLKERGVSQTFLSEKTGIPYKRINYIVTENGDVKNDEIFKIADALNVDVNFFNPNSKKLGEEC